jgi:hypothetical protein
VWEPVDCEGITDAKCACDVALVAAVVLGGRADVPTVDSMRRHALALVGRDVHDDTGAGRG